LRLIADGDVDVITLNSMILNGDVRKSDVESLYDQRLIMTTMPCGGVVPMKVRVTKDGRRLKYMALRQAKRGTGT